MNEFEIVDWEILIHDKKVSFCQSTHNKQYPD